jgi:hypothetical protein
MKVPWKIVGLAGIAGVTAATGVVVARKRRDHTEYDPDELRDKLHSRIAESDEPLAEADTKIHTSPHGDKAAEGTAGDSPAEATAGENPVAGTPGEQPAEGTPAPGEGDGAPHTSSAS